MLGPVQPYVSEQVLEGTLAAMLAAAGLLLAVVAGARWGRGWRTRRQRGPLAALRPVLLEVASGEDEDGAAVRRLTMVPPREVRLVDAAVAATLSKVRGEPARALAQVLHEHGRAQWARRGLGSASA
ncbi:MAG: HEAT repeat domain-containing protein, partial [Actinomycetota bacterium]